jgi:hypothetical protein
MREEKWVMVVEVVGVVELVVVLEVVVVVLGRDPEEEEEEEEQEVLVLVLVLVELGVKRARCIMRAKGSSITLRFLN